MNCTDLEGLVKKVTGLDSVTIGSSAIERAAQARATACALDARSYLERVRTSATELQALIEAIVVPETWFFRDPEAFAALCRMAREWLHTHPETTLRLLSLPCSTGEEPYSMAMALLDAGIPAQRFQIDAIDISAQALAHAQRGVYRRNSFRGTELGFRDRHFEATAQGHCLRDRARQPVRFRQGNILSTELSSAAATYHWVFCRNLLIYFDRATQDRAVGVLRSLLVPEGTLFVGPSESGLLMSHDFVPARVPLAFAFHKVAANVRTAAALPRPVQSRKPAVQPVAQRAAVQPVTVPDPVSSEQLLADAVCLADQGHLVEATRCCEAHLRKYGPSAQALYLLGLISAAVGNVSEARQYYRKALYLDQDHYDTLLHLGLLLEQQGETAGAQILRNRLRRLDQGGAAI